MKQRIFMIQNKPPSLYFGFLRIHFLNFWVLIGISLFEIILQFIKLFFLFDNICLDTNTLKNVEIEDKIGAISKQFFFYRIQKSRFEKLFKVPYLCQPILTFIINVFIKSSLFFIQTIQLSTHFINLCLFDNALKIRQ